MGFAGRGLRRVHRPQLKPAETLNRILHNPVQIDRTPFDLTALEIDLKIQRPVAPSADVPLKKLHALRPNPNPKGAHQPFQTVAIGEKRYAPYLVPQPV